MKKSSFLVLLILASGLLVGCGNIREEDIVESNDNDIEQIDNNNFTANIVVYAGVKYADTQQVDMGYNVSFESAGRYSHALYSGNLLGQEIGLETYSDLGESFSNISDTDAVSVYSRSLNGDTWTKNDIIFGKQINSIVSKLQNVDYTDIFGESDGEYNEVEYYIDGGKIINTLEGIELPIVVGYSTENGLPLKVEIDLSNALVEMTDIFNKKFDELGYTTYNIAEFNEFTVYIEYSNFGNTVVEIPDDAINAEYTGSLLNLNLLGEGFDLFDISTWDVIYDATSGLNWEAYGIDRDNFLESSHIKDYLDLLGLGQYFEKE